MIKKRKYKKRKNPIPYIGKSYYLPANQPIIGIKSIGILQDPIYIINSGDSKLPLGPIEYEVFEEESGRVYSLGGITPAGVGFDQYQELDWVIRLISDEFIKLGPKKFKEKYFNKSPKFILNNLFGDYND